jgi:hypothetical protein
MAAVPLAAPMHSALRHKTGKTGKNKDSSAPAIATTTRLTPAAITASVQGGVRPWWQQGSSVTTRVPPRARSPAWAEDLYRE